MNNTKAITNIPGWSSLFQSNELNSAAQAYAYVPLIYRALRLRCDSLASVPVSITGKGDAAQDWPYTSKLSTLIWHTEAALLLEGIAFWEKVGNPMGMITDVAWRNPYDMKLEYKDNILKIEQESSRAKWTNDLKAGTYEMVYFHEFHPTNDITDGIGAVESALSDAQLIRYLTRFSSIFFEQGAQPLTLLGFEGTPTPEEKQRTESFFKRSATGIKNAWRVFAFRGGVDVHTITPPLKDMVIPELNTQARENIAHAFGIPQTMLADAANFATAVEHRLSFWQDTIRPRALIYEDVINTQLLNKQGLEFAFNFNEMDIFQTDEAERSDSLLKLTQAGYSLLMASEILGYDLTEDQRKELIAEQAAKEERRTEMAERLQNTPRQQESVPNFDSSDNMRTDLGKWRRKAEKRLKGGTTPAVEFESDEIPGTLKAAIMGALEGVETMEGLATVFENAEAWKAYP